jgi:hypothetical protein
LFGGVVGQAGSFGERAFASQLHPCVAQSTGATPTFDGAQKAHVDAYGQPWGAVQL